MCISDPRFSNIKQVRFSSYFLPSSDQNTHLYWLLQRTLMMNLYCLEKKESKWDWAILRSLHVFLTLSHYFQICPSSESRLTQEQPFSDWSKRSGPEWKNNIKVESKCLKVWKTNIKQREESCTICFELQCWWWKEIRWRDRKRKGEKTSAPTGESGCDSSGVGSFVVKGLVEYGVLHCYT